MIELTEEERIVERGAHTTHWFVRLHDDWLPVAKAPGATTELVQKAGPGVVWRRHVRLELVLGALLLKVESAPRTLARTPLEHLMKSRSTPQRTRRSVYSVSSHGDLVPVPSETDPRA